MADVKVPGAGRVPKPALYAGGALVIGVVGYAWIARSRRASTAADIGTTADTSLPDPTVPTVTTTTVPDNTDVIATNAQWTQRAVEYLTGQGFDPVFVTVTLGKYLARRPLNTSEQDVVVAAIGAFGQPPVGGPYTITTALPNPPTTSNNYQYVVQHHQIATPETAWNLIKRFSDPAVTTDDRIRYALVLTTKEPHNAKYLPYYGSHDGRFPANADLLVHVIKAK